MGTSDKALPFLSDETCQPNCLPVSWLADVLRGAGLDVWEDPAWRTHGHGAFVDVWGVMAHHTGVNRDTEWMVVRDGTASLSGPLSQLVLEQNGLYRVVASGVAWHAGAGSYPGLPDDNANYYTLGIEAVNTGSEGWSPVQYDAYVLGVAAILSYLGHDSSRVIGHKEWAGAAQGKWDPGGIDMNDFRADVQARIDGGGARCGSSPFVVGAIYEKYEQLGGCSSFLGVPVTEERAAPDGFGRYSVFENGSIYWTEATGAHEVHGQIRDKWSDLDWEAGPLGYPTSDEAPTLDGIGRFNHFQHGSIYWTPDGRAFAVLGSIHDAWADSGWETGPLGYPTSDEYEVPEGRRSDFELGYVVHDESTDETTIVIDSGSDAGAAGGGGQGGAAAAGGSSGTGSGEAGAANAGGSSAAGAAGRGQVGAGGVGSSTGAPGGNGAAGNADGTTATDRDPCSASSDCGEMALPGTAGSSANASSGGCRMARVPAPSSPPFLLIGLPAVACFRRSRRRGSARCIPRRVAHRST